MAPILSRMLVFVVVSPALEPIYLPFPFVGLKQVGATCFGETCSPIPRICYMCVLLLSNNIFFFWMKMQPFIWYCFWQSELKIAVCTTWIWRWGSVRCHQAVCLSSTRLVSNNVNINSLKTKQVKVLFYLILPDFWKSNAFWKHPRLCPFVLLVSLYVWSTMEFYWQKKIEVLGEKPVPLPLCAPQISHGLNYDGIRASAWEAGAMGYLVCLFSWRYNPFGCIFHSPVAGFSLLIRGSVITHNDAPESVGLLWTSDQLHGRP